MAEKSSPKLPPAYEEDVSSNNVYVDMQDNPAQSAAAAAARQYQPYPAPPIANTAFPPATSMRPSLARGNWEFTLCDCLKDASVCCMTYWLPFLTEWRISAQLGNPRFGLFLLLLGLFLWWPVQTILLGFLYTPVLHAQMHSSLDYDYDGEEAERAIAGYVMVRAVLGLVAFSLGVVRLVLLVIQRGQLRQRRSIKGNALEDCCCLYWCGGGCCPLALCQMKMELDFAEQIQQEENIRAQAVAQASIQSSGIQSAGGGVDNRGFNYGRM